MSDTTTEQTKDHQNEKMKALRANILALMAAADVAGIVVLADIDQLAKLDTDHPIVEMGFEETYEMEVAASSGIFITTSRGVLARSEHEYDGTARTLADYNNDQQAFKNAINISVGHCKALQTMLKKVSHALDKTIQKIPGKHSTHEPTDLLAHLLTKILMGR